MVLGVFVSHTPHLHIPFTLQISAVPEEAPGCPVDFRSCKIDIHAIHGAGIETTWTYSRRLLADTQAPNFDLRRV
ncbi:hypothetical protein EQU24_01580 [Methylotuvimicrobium buryatense]|uniref:Uncharacterized protein n=1 Tax=Methylotuvimicrobium buryatense TaxID=95641 RepID=A0A4P9UNL8_METBY|nr:hypothetical protein EQU24_01580 [Methylotuvimicrobium buryatense]